MTPDDLLRSVVRDAPTQLPSLGDPAIQPYLRSYREFIRCCRALRPVDSAAIVVAAGLVYSWMPTVLKLGSEADVLGAAGIVEDGGRPDALTAAGFLTIARAVGGSPVGASKLLHLFHPEFYPIWDSRVWSYFGWHAAEVREGAGERYLRYVQLATAVAGSEEFTPVHLELERRIGYPVSRVRALELVMFLAGRAGLEP